MAGGRGDLPEHGYAWRGAGSDPARVPLPRRVAGRASRAVRKPRGVAHCPGGERDDLPAAWRKQRVVVDASAPSLRGHLGWRG